MARGKVRNLVHQIESAIYSRYKPGVDKDSLMIKGKKGGKHLPEGIDIVFCIKSRNAYLDVGRMAMRYIMEHYPDIRYVKDVPVDAVNEFLVSKAPNNSTAALIGYASKMRSNGRFVNKFFRTANVDLIDKRVIVPKSGKTTKNERLWDMQIEREDYERCLAYATRPGTRRRAHIGWELSVRFGPRASGCGSVKVSDVRLDLKGRFGFGRIRFCEKGKRLRLVAVRTEDDRKLLEDLSRGRDPDELLVGITDDAINKALNRTLKALGLKSKYPYTSIHGLRKLFAGRCWDANRAELSYMENVMDVNKQLGHGVLRNVKLLRVYVPHLEKY